MRILRLALRNYRGVEEREIEFAPRGVTIVAGPNEVGKSSLGEALELLFEELDDTTKQRVREVQPVDRDEGAEVEADIETGAYAFTYTKRFHRRTATQLRLRRPRVETRTGREAHERVRQILDETLDVALWRALRHQQGEALAQPELGRAPTLAAALDRAAGASGGKREESLFDAAREACERYFTPTGRPRRELGAAERELDEARGVEDDLRGQLDAVERDVASERALRQRVAELEAQVAAGRAALRDARGELEALRALREELARLEAERDAARAEERLATQAAREREQLAGAHAEAVAQRESLAQALEREEPDQRAAGVEHERAQERLARAREGETRAALREQRARRDASFRREERELARLRERAEGLAREELEVQRARRLLAGARIDESRAREIHAAQLAVERARAHLAAEGPTLELLPARALEVEVDGRRTVLAAGEPLRRHVSEKLSLSLPGVAEITVAPGSGVAERRKALEQAETALRGLCAEADVDDYAGAIAALETRRSAERSLASSERRRAEILGGETAARLAARREELAPRVCGYRAQRGDELPLPGTPEEADSALGSAEAGAARAREEVESLAREAHERALHLDRLAQRRSEDRRRLEEAEQRVAQLAARLAAARAEEPDDALAGRSVACAAAARQREAQAREAAERLAARAPQQVEARAAALRETLGQHERALRESRDALLRLCERLEVVGSQGLFERWETARVDRRRAERALAARRRRAAAARQLFEVLREERDAARRGYAAPLARQIALLGRPLFGPSFGVELADDLHIERRVLDGRSLVVRQLSAGAREQLALLARLAAARVAGGDEGVPLLLDDALGHTDPERLAALGPVLAQAGRAGQVIVLTCTPERFRGVGEARLVELH